MRLAPWAGRIHVWQVLGLVLLVGGAGVYGGVSVVSANEQHDSFCISCHTEPESDYYTRFQQAVTSGQAVDLASYHHRQVYPPKSPAAQNIRCIDCHGGEGLAGRTIVVSLAAWDALKYLTRTDHQPATLVFNVQNEACIKCHDQQVKLNLNKPRIPFIIDNHYHYQLFEPGAPFEACASCHPSHREGAEANQFQFRDVIIPVCEDCHRREGKGPMKM
jgi:hypothetical protein